MTFRDILRARRGQALDQARRLGPEFYSEAPSEDRPPGPKWEKIQVGKARPMAMFPKKYSEALEYNQKINICCRHMENITGRTYKTHPDLPGPDLFIATCICGRNHYRLAVGEQ
jgi:hypothetical protein